MAFKINTQSPSSSLLCSIPTLFLSFTFLFSLSLALFFFFHFSPSQPFLSQNSLLSNPNPNILKVFVAELPRSLNYGLLQSYWSHSAADTRIGADADAAIRSRALKASDFPPFPENPIIKQYSAEYWLLGDLVTPPAMRASSVAERVGAAEEADVVFVPFFATMSAELQLGIGKGVFRKKVESNEDYLRQRHVMDFLKNTEAWKRSGGRDHVFVLTDPMAMWHVRAELAPAILLVVDFGGWWKFDKLSNGSDVIQHRQVSLIKDVIVPYTHLLPRLQLSEDKPRNTLLYFKGAKHRHRGGRVREQLWDLLVDEPSIVIEEGFPNATGRDQSIKGMRSSEFCLHPAGDTPSSCRLFDAIQSLCIPVIVSDNIELPFEGMLDYSEFSISVAVADALTPKWLVSHLKRFSKSQKDKFRKKMAEVQHVFQYDNGHPGGIGPVPWDGAVNHIWRKIHQKLPLIKEAIVRKKRKPPGVSIPLRCQCT